MLPAQLKINMLNIKRFRGIPGSVDVPLDAPLTLIYAANGTGKSTICQAVEWLLTGRIVDIDSSAIKCKWGNLETSVSADCTYRGTRLQLIRDESGLKRFYKGEYKDIDTLEFLKALTPASIAANKRKDLAIKERSEWLRGTRWLYSTALGLLIDNEHVEQREQIFADILGYGHLTPVRKNLKAYIRALPGTRSLEANEADVLRQIAHMKASVGAAKPGVFLDAIQNVWGVLNQTEPARLDDHNAKLDAVNAALSMHEQNFATNSEFINALVAGLPSASSSFVKVEEYRKKVNELTQARQVAVVRLEQDRKLLSTSKDNIKVTDNNVAWANSVDAALADLEGLREFTSRCSPPIDFDQTTAQLITSFPEMFLPLERLTEVKGNAESFNRKYARFDELRASRKAVLAALKDRPSPDSLKVAGESVSSSKKGLEDLRKGFSKITDALTQLKSLGGEFVEEHPHATDCPLCGHDWEERSALVGALQGAEGALDPALLSLQALIAESAQRLGIVEKNLAMLNERHRTAVVNELNLNQIEAELNAAITGSPFKDSISFDSIDGVTEKFITDYLERISFAQSAASTLNYVQQLEVFLKKDTSTISFNDRLLSAKKDLSETLRRFLVEQSADLKAEISAVAAVAATDAEISKTAISIKDVETDISTLLQEQKKFLDACRGLSLESIPPSIEEVTSLERKHTETKARLEVARSHAAAARATIKESVALAEVERLEAERSRVRALIESAQLRISEAERVHNIYDEHITKLSKAQIAPLLGPAAELFSRMHANEVYNGIGIDPEEGRLIWSALVDGLTMDAAAMFSQGQRQDLALSLYLSRAKSIGGTFFLDEPIAHLDDLNRVAMLDTFRVLTQSEPEMSMVLTTSSDNLMRHMTQKFSTALGGASLRVVTLKGNPRTGVSVSVSDSVSHIG
jgi:exonuclease SbcC